MRERGFVVVTIRPLVAGIAVFAGGCSIFSAAERQGSTPIPLSAVVLSLQRDLSRSHPLALSNIHGDDRVLDHFPNKDEVNLESTEVQLFRKSVANLQCYDVVPRPTKETGKDKQRIHGNKNEESRYDSALRQRDPLIPVATGALQLAVQGTFSTQAGAAITVPASVSFQIQRQAQQQITLPTTLVPLLNVPIFYMGQQLANVQFTQPFGLDKNAQVVDYTARTVATMKVLKSLIDQSHAAFDAAGNNEYCKDRDDGLDDDPAAVVFFGAPP
jgi:hypothetical protein